MAVFRVPYAESNTPHTFQITARDADEAELMRAEGSFTVGRDAHLMAGMSQVVPIVGTASVKLERPGISHITASVDGVISKAITFEALAKSPK